MLWKHPMSYSYQSYSWVSSLSINKALWSKFNMPMNILTSWPWPMTLTLELDLDISPLELHAKIHIRMSVCSAGIVRPVHFARPTSGTNEFESRTCPFCPQQVPRTCLAISQLPLDPHKSMTYLSVSTFHDKSDSFVRIIVGSLIKK